jgi:asparagine synthase (glutamine-hydrolysing)
VAVREALGRAVARQRVADVPLGCFLSGGLDSSIIALHLAECTPGPISTFALGHAELPRYDETSYARLVARHVGSNHHELRITWRDVLGALPALLDHQGEPFFDSSIVAAALVSQLARGHVTVCLSGDGGDELFGGYWRYLGHDALASYRRLPSWLRHGVIEPLLGLGKSSRTTHRADRLRQLRKLLCTADGDAPARHLAWATILPAEARAILKPGVCDSTLADVHKVFESIVARMPADDKLNRILAFDLRYGLPFDMLHKVDLASMFHSLEVRVPFLAEEVVALAEALPGSFKVQRGLRKRILTDAYRGRLPDEVLERGKMGFEIPIGEFLRNELRPLFLDMVTPARLERFGMIDPAAVLRVFEDHCIRRADHADFLYAILALCWWSPGA